MASNRLAPSHSTNTSKPSLSYSSRRNSLSYSAPSIPTKSAVNDSNKYLKSKLDKIEEDKALTQCTPVHEASESDVPLSDAVNPWTIASNADKKAIKSDLKNDFLSSSGLLTDNTDVLSVSETDFGSNIHSNIDSSIKSTRIHRRFYWFFIFLKSLKNVAAAYTDAGTVVRKCTWINIGSIDL